jgi:hypothetical protein
MRKKAKTNPESYKSVLFGLSRPGDYDYQLHQLYWPVRVALGFLFLCWVIIVVRSGFHIYRLAPSYSIELAFFIMMILTNVADYVFYRISNKAPKTR